MILSIILGFGVGLAIQYGRAAWTWLKSVGPRRCYYCRRPISDEEIPVAITMPEEMPVNVLRIVELTSEVSCKALGLGQLPAAPINFFDCQNFRGFVPDRHYHLRRGRDGEFEAVVSSDGSIAHRILIYGRVGARHLAELVGHELFHAAKYFENPAAIEAENHEQEALDFGRGIQKLVIPLLERRGLLSGCSRGD